MQQQGGYDDIIGGARQHQRVSAAAEQQQQQARYAVGEGTGGPVELAARRADQSPEVMARRARAERGAARAAIGANPCLRAAAARIVNNKARRRSE